MPESNRRPQHLAEVGAEDQPDRLRLDVRRSPRLDVGLNHG
jgi:hypothetical protein